MKAVAGPQFPARSRARTPTVYIPYGSAVTSRRTVAFSVTESNAPSAADIGVASPTPGSGPTKSSAAAIGVWPVARSLTVAATVVAGAVRVGFGPAERRVTSGPTASPAGEYRTERRGTSDGRPGHPGGYPEAHWKMLPWGPVGPSMRTESAPVFTRSRTAAYCAGGTRTEPHVPGLRSAFRSVGVSGKSAAVALTVV